MQQKLPTLSAWSSTSARRREDEISRAISSFREADAIEDALRRGLAPTVSKLDEVLARLPPAPDDASSPAEQTAEGEVIRFPATRQVDQIDVAVAAGGGAEAEDEAVTERLTFRLDWLKSHGLDPSQCTVVKVQGESMEPTLPEGSAILVDRARRRRRVGGIFVVRTADGVVVKRAGKDRSRPLAAPQRPPGLGARALARRRSGARRGEVDGPDAVSRGRNHGRDSFTFCSGWNVCDTGVVQDCLDRRCTGAGKARQAVVGQSV